MTWEEIKQCYPDEWVLIAFTELDATLQVVQGEVIVHSPHKAEINQQLITLDNERIAIEFTGEMPEEPAYLFMLEASAYQAIPNNAPVPCPWWSYSLRR